MKLLISELVSVSNNSILTNKLLAKLNNNLDPQDLQLFRDWLRIVKQKQQTSKGNRYEFR